MFATVGVDGVVAPPIGVVGVAFVELTLVLLGVPIAPALALSLVPVVALLMFATVGVDGVVAPPIGVIGVAFVELTLASSDDCAWLVLASTAPAAMPAKIAEFGWAVVTGVNADIPPSLTPAVALTDLLLSPLEGVGVLPEGLLPSSDGGVLPPLGLIGLGVGLAESPINGALGTLGTTCP